MDCRRSTRRLFRIRDHRYTAPREFRYEAPASRVIRSLSGESGLSVHFPGVAKAAIEFLFEGGANSFFTDKRHDERWHPNVH